MIAGVSHGTAQATEADQTAATVGSSGVLVPIEVTTRATPSTRTYEVQGGDTLAAIADGCHDLSSIGHRLKAGTNCGSCVPELRRLIANAESHQLAENLAHQLIAE